MTQGISDYVRLKLWLMNMQHEWNAHACRIICANTYDTYFYMMGIQSRKTSPENAQVWVHLNDLMVSV